MLSSQARERLLSRRGEPWFSANWLDVLMIHFEVNPDEMKREVPFSLDLWNGRAFVSLVAFSMRRMRPCFGGRLAAWFFRPVASHQFLNVRTYVQHRGEPGIHFLAEWLSSRLAVQLGPVIFGLPYRFARIAYSHQMHCRNLSGRVTDVASGDALVYKASVGQATESMPCETGSLTEWLMERYTAFTFRDGTRRFFRIWHPPWLKREAEVSMEDLSLLTRHWPWFREAVLVEASLSPGFCDVWMGRPHFA